MILLFKVHETTSEVLSSVSEHEKAVMSLTEKFFVLDNLQSGMTCTAADCELYVKDSTVHINKVSLNKTHIKRGCVLMLQ
jgi:hypothetical protein